MKISEIECFRVPPRWLFVRVQSDDGAVGWGEASLEGHAEAVVGVFAAFRDRFIGADPFRIEDIWQVAYRGGCALNRNGLSVRDFARFLIAPELSRADRYRRVLVPSGRY